MRHVGLAAVLAVILALTLIPAVLLRLYPNETLGYVLNPLWESVKSRTGLAGEIAGPIGLVTAFVIAVVAASALSLILVGELFRSVRGS